MLKTIISAASAGLAIAAFALPSHAKHEFATSSIKTRAVKSSAKHVLTAKVQNCEGCPLDSCPIASKADCGTCPATGCDE